MSRHSAAALLLAGTGMLAGCDSGNPQVTSPNDDPPARKTVSQRAGGDTPDTASAEVPPVLRFTMATIDGRRKRLADYRGRVLLIVNTASQCGFTAQYEGLQSLHERFSNDGLAVLGFPANNFGDQEPGSDEQIAAFCKRNYGVDFDMFSKISVAGDDRHPLYGALTSADAPPAGIGPVKWNFEKFLVSRDGRIVARFRSNVAPSDAVMLQAVQREMAAGR